MPIRF